MKETDLCVVMTKAEWDEVIADERLCSTVEKKSFSKGDVILHDGKPYLCICDTEIINPIGYSWVWKAIHVQH